MTFKKTLIIGLGLIGGSFAKALRKNKISAEIFACDPDSETLDFAQSGAIIDKGFDELEHCLEDLKTFDLIVIASPLSTYEEIFFDLVKNTAPNCIIIDLGSVKDLRLKNLPKNFVPCHPIAGSQNSGFEFATDNLFEGKKFVICSETPEAKKIAELAKKIGAKPEFMDAKEHDDIYALVSHLPQFLSFLTKEFSPKNIKDDFFKTAFRLDDSDPQLWEEIFDLNEIRLEKFYIKFFDNLEKEMENLGNFKFKPNGKNEKFDEKFLEDNFAAIFFRALTAKSLLEISEIKSFESYAGTGFGDFTSILNILNYDAEKLQNLLNKNRDKITKIFNSIS